MNDVPFKDLYYTLYTFKELIIGYYEDRLDRA